MVLGEEFALLGIFLGVSCGIIFSMVGLAGGIIIIPISIFLLGFSPKEAIVVSLFFMTGTVISASIRYMKLKLVDYKLALLYSVWDIPGVILGGIITLFISNNILAGICGTFIIFLSLLLFRGKNNDNKEEIQDQEIKDESKPLISHPLISSASSFSGGFISGLVGLGGGTVDTTSMILLGLEPKTAAATGEVGNIVSPLTGVIIHLILGTFLSSWIWPIMLTIGGVIGAQIGASFAPRVKGKTIRKILASIALYSGFLMIILMFGIGWAV